MFNKELFDKICKADCSLDELEDLVINIDLKEFDLDKPFEKYYDLESILSVIEKYRKGKISDKYLAQWMNAYNWIIMGGFKIEDDEPVNLEKLVIWQICDWLDSLSFFDCGARYDLEKYEDSFKTLDLIYRNYNDYEAAVAQYGFNDDDAVVLVISARSKHYAIIYCEFDFTDNYMGIKQVNFDEIKSRIKSLKEQCYTKLAYGVCDNIDLE